MTVLFLVIKLKNYAGQASLGSFFIQTRDIMSRFFHRFHNFIKADPMVPVRHERIDICINSTGCCKRISFYTRYLHQTHYGIASKPQKMFYPHGGTVFYLHRSTAEQLDQSTGRHAASGSYLSLASNFRPRYGSICLDEIPNKTGCRESPENFFIGKIIIQFIQIKYCLKGKL